MENNTMNAISNNNDVNNISNNFDIGNISNNNFNNNVRSDSSEEDFETIEKTEVSSDEASAQVLADRISSYRKKLCDIYKSNHKELSDEEAKEKVLLAFSDNDLEVLSQIEDLLYPLQESDKDYLLNLFYEFSGVLGHRELKIDKGNFYPYRLNFLSRIIPEFDKNKEVEDFLSKNDREYKLIDVILERAEKPREALYWFLDKDFRAFVDKNPTVLEKLIAIYNTRGKSGPAILSEIKSKFKSNYNEDINIDELRGLFNFDFEKFIGEGERNALLPFDIFGMSDKKMKEKILGEYYFNAMNSYVKYRNAFFGEEQDILNDQNSFSFFYILSYEQGVYEQDVDDRLLDFISLASFEEAKLNFLLTSKYIKQIDDKFNSSREGGFDDVLNSAKDLLEIEFINFNSKMGYYRFKNPGNVLGEEYKGRYLGNNHFSINFANVSFASYRFCSYMRRIAKNPENRLALYNVLLNPVEINNLSVTSEDELEKFVNSLIDFVKHNPEYRLQLKLIAENLDLKSKNVKQFLADLKPFTEIELNEEHVLSERRNLLPKNIPNCADQLLDEILARVDNRTLSDVNKLAHLISNFNVVYQNNFVPNIPYGFMRLICQNPDNVFAIKDIMSAESYLSLSNETKDYIIANRGDFLSRMFAYRPDFTFDFCLACVVNGDISVDSIVNIVLSRPELLKYLNDDAFIKLVQIAPEGFKEKILNAIEMRMTEKIEKKDNPEFKAEFKERADNLAKANKIVKSGKKFLGSYFTVSDYFEALKREDTGLATELPSQNDVSAIDSALNQKFPQGLNPEVRNILKADYRMVLNWKIDGRVMKLLGNKKSAKKLITICKAQHLQPVQFLQIVDKLNGGNLGNIDNLTKLLSFDFDSSFNPIKDNYPDMSKLMEKERDSFLSEMYMNAVRFYCKNNCPNLQGDPKAASWFYFNASVSAGVDENLLKSTHSALLLDTAKEYRNIMSKIDISEADQTTIIAELKKKFPDADENEINVRNWAMGAISNSINIYKTNPNLAVLSVIANPEFIVDVDFNTISPVEFAYMLTSKLDSMCQQGKLYDILACLDLSSDVAQALLNNINNISYGIKKKEVIRVKKEKYSSDLDKVKPSTMRAIQDNIFEVMSLADIRSTKCKDMLKFFFDIKSEIDTIPTWLSSKAKMFVSGNLDQAENKDMLMVFNANKFSDLCDNAVNNFINSIEGEADFRLEFLIFQKPDFIVSVVGQLNKAKYVQISEIKKINFAKYLLNALSYASKHPQFISTKFRDLYSNPQDAISIIINNLSPELLRQLSKQNLNKPAKSMVNKKLQLLPRTNTAPNAGVPLMEATGNVTKQSDLIC